MAWQHSYRHGNCIEVGIWCGFDHPLVRGLLEGMMIRAGKITITKYWKRTFTKFAHWTSFSYSIYIWGREWEEGKRKEEAFVVIFHCKRCHIKMPTLKRWKEFVLKRTKEAKCREVWNCVQTASRDIGNINKLPTRRHETSRNHVQMEEEPTDVKISMLVGTVAVATRAWCKQKTLPFAFPIPRVMQHFPLHK